MKRIIVLLLALCLLLSGCSWLDGEYHSVTPHARDESQQIQEGVIIENYFDLRNALVDMVAAGATENTFYLVDIDQSSVTQYMSTAIMHVQRSTALGAYAVEEITYESGIVAGREAIAVDISYIHGRQEIMRIKKVQTMNSAKKLIIAAVNACNSDVVIQVADYEALDIVQFIQDYVDTNPDICMEMPQVAAAIYPEAGMDRVIELSFTYQTSRESLRNMQDMVAPIFAAAKMYVQGSEDILQKCEQLYSFLMERFDYKYETSINPTYSLLRYGVGDSKAFATVYSVMCRNAGVSCEVVVGSRNGEAWTWNLIEIDDVFYHLDLLACHERGEFSLLTSDEMDGYVWDYSVYP